MSDGFLEYHIILVVFSVINIIGVIVSIFVYIFWCKLKSIGFIQLILMCISCGIFSLVTLISTIIDGFQKKYNVEHNMSVCNLEGFCMLGGMIMTFVMSTSICYVLYSEFIASQIQESIQSRKYIKKFYVLSIVVPILAGIVPICSNTYGTPYPKSEIQICYIDPITPGQNKHPKLNLIIGAKIEIVLLVVFPYIISSIFNITVIAKFHKILKLTQQEQEMDKSQLSFIKGMLTFPLIVFFSWMFHIIRLIIQCIDSDLVQNDIWIMSDLILSLLGGISMTSLFLVLMKKTVGKKSEQIPYKYAENEDLYVDLSVSYDAETYLSQSQTLHQTKSANSRSYRKTSYLGQKTQQDPMINNRIQLIRERNKIQNEKSLFISTQEHSLNFQDNNCYKPSNKIENEPRRFGTESPSKPRNFSEEL